MPRLSIDIPAETHKRLKAMAALEGVSLKDYVLSRALSDDPMTQTGSGELTEALQEELSYEEADARLAAFLEERLREIDEGKTVRIPNNDLVAYFMSRAPRN